MRLISEEIMSRAAGGLLTSSESRRYTRMAKECAMEMFPEMDDSLRDKAMERVNSLANIMAKSTERTEDEIEVAVLLAALAHHHWEVSAPLLHAIMACHMYPCLVHVAGEARMLLNP